MNISYYFKNLEPSDAIKDYAREKLDKLNQRLHHIEAVDARFYLLREKQGFEVTVHADATVFHLKKSDKDMYAAIDLAVDVLGKQVERYRNKLEDKTAPFDKFDILPQYEEREAGDEYTISVYSAPVKPMSDAEAVLQLRANRYQFLMYHHADEERYSLVMGRPDGNYSVVTPREGEIGHYNETVSRFIDGDLKEVSQNLYQMSRITMAEAIEQLEETGASFIVFVNDESSRMNLLFRSKNGELVLKKPANS